MLAIDSSRTRAYLQAMIFDDLLPAYAVVLAGNRNSPTIRVPYFDNTTPSLELICRMDIPHLVLDTDDINSSEVINALQVRQESVFVYSGLGGAILCKELLSTGKRFMHIHSGLLPRFRGSTTVYYSLLVQGKCGASAFFLDREIDNGPVIATQVYPAPADRTTIDYGYDPYIRSDLLMRVLKAYRTNGEFATSSQSEKDGETYHIIHPVLKHIAILACGKTGNQS